ncbi:MULTISPECIES: flagellar biosynthesis protein FlhB [unclassified Uliginosibacterium]|uniref:flagellar biosynthesis protein FlhB n=1 Tax=unclassified Uliginosibacterium TaxID=2621521 RepID=UPI000C7A7AF1|nr:MULTISPECIES: flagellar biosynthesis protein FlhB [unclassified Uliginosibacterium]MDO6385169.1 flagellar biosynthesis protein FlhB [Uliginosibacterium sp. 31-12]PLK48842.1 flagellar biosynthetic protein FlhB [Uliginosibacterium sp. TH139]
MAEGSDLEKTEPASGRRIEQARADGQVPQSRELASFLTMISAVLTLLVVSRWMVAHASALMRGGLSFGREQSFNSEYMYEQLLRLSIDALTALLPFFVVMLVAAVAAPVMMGGLIFSFKAFQLDLNRLDPLNGLKRMASMHGVAELVKGLLKSGLIGSIGCWVLWSQRGEIVALMSMPLESGMSMFGDMLLMSLLWVVASLALVAALDVPFQLWRYYEGLKMTKEELKQEYKEMEGDPQLKARIRARQRDMARRRMMAAVPKADVVVTNPTHYAVALKYEAGAMGAPTVVAKGADLVAQAIRELAQEHKVPLLEAPPLARALFRHSEVGDQVPAALYTAVAEVMAYVYQLNHFLAQGGLPPERPHDLDVPPELDPGAATAPEAAGANRY